MSEEETRQKDASKRLHWFSEMVNNLPVAGEGSGSLAKAMTDIESARVIRTAGEFVTEGMGGRTRKRGLDKGLDEGLEVAGKRIITEKLTEKDPIRAKVDEALGEVVGEALKKGLSGGGRASEAELELAQIKRDKELEAMFQEFHTKVVAPLQEQVKELAAKKEGAGGKMSTDEAVEMVMNAQDRAKKLLEGAGFNVESVNVSKAEVTKMIEEEQTKFNERLAKEKEEWEKDKGATVEIESKRIEATENFLSNLADRFFVTILEPFRDEIHKALKSGAFQRQQPRT